MATAFFVIAWLKANWGGVVAIPAVLWLCKAATRPPKIELPRPCDHGSKASVWLTLKWKADDRVRHGGFHTRVCTLCNAVQKLHGHEGYFDNNDFHTNPNWCDADKFDRAVAWGYSRREPHPPAQTPSSGPADPWKSCVLPPLTTATMNDALAAADAALQQRRAAFYEACYDLRSHGRFALKGLGRFADVPGGHGVGFYRGMGGIPGTRCGVCRTNECSARLAPFGLTYCDRCFDENMNFNGPRTSGGPCPSGAGPIDRSLPPPRSDTNPATASGLSSSPAGGGSSPA